MKLNKEMADIYVPDGLEIDQALARTTHMAVGAHQDDLEIMAFAGILACFQRPDKWFSAVVVTDGRGSARDNIYKDYTDEEMRLVRLKEQKKAAFVGEYATQAFLDYPSSAVKDGKNKAPVEDLHALFTVAKPEVVYTHNLGDKHDTHVGVALKTIEALRRLPEADRPKQVLGCEVWRDLDWMTDSDKLPLDCSLHENLQAALLGVFDSQIAGGKRYDLATMGRRKAHATYFASHGVDETTGLNFAMNLTPLVLDTSLEPLSWIQAHIDRFREEVTARINKLQG